MESRSKIRCVLVEDDEKLGPLLQRQLEDRGFRIKLLTSVGEAISYNATPACAIVDWNLPDGEGPQIVAAWRKRGWLFPIILLTARSGLDDKIHALQSGAADYLTKPFELSELVARIQALLRLSTEAVSGLAADSQIRVGPLTIEPTSGEVFWKENAVELAKLEFQLLLFLARAPGRVFTREEILSRVWGDEISVTNRTVDNHVLQLRKKIDPQLIETIWSTGYRLKTLGIIFFLALNLLCDLVGKMAFAQSNVDFDVQTIATKLTLEGKESDALSFMKKNYWDYVPKKFDEEKSMQRLIHSLLMRTTRKTELYPDKFVRLDGNECVREMTKKDLTLAFCSNGMWSATLTRSERSRSESLEIRQNRSKDVGHEEIVRMSNSNLHIDSSALPWSGRSWFGRALHLRIVKEHNRAQPRLRALLVRVFLTPTQSTSDAEAFLLAYSANDPRCPMAFVNASRNTDAYDDILDVIDLAADTFACHQSSPRALSSY